MMSPAPRKRYVFLGAIGLLMLGTAGTTFVSCASGPRVHGPHGPPHHPPGDAPDVIYCRGPEDCQDSAWYPECADYNYVTCVAPEGSMQRQCVFRVIGSSYYPDCFCLERDMRACKLPDDTPGVQHCEKQGQNSTAWGTCVACESTLSAARRSLPQAEPQRP